MKKAMLLASLAALCISGNAMALVADGTPLKVFIAAQPAGFMTIFPFGPGVGGNMGSPMAPFGSCLYHARWSSNWAPANSLTCTLTEVSTANSQGCSLDPKFSFPTLVTAGATTCGTFGLTPTMCSGWDNFGMPHFGTVELLLAETVRPPGPPVSPGIPGIPVLCGLVTFKDFFNPMPWGITIDC